MKVYEGKLVSQDMKIGIVAARFNEFIVSKLIGGCEDTLLRHGVRPEDISLAWVPGAGHEANLDAPEALAGILADFYRRIGAAL